MASHLHKRFTNEQAKNILQEYQDRVLTLAAALGQLGLKRRHFFELLEKYRAQPDNFTIAWKRKSAKRLTEITEQKIKDELLKEKRLIEDKTIPIKHYNYSAVKDLLKEKYDVTVSVPTIIARAKTLDCYQERKPRALHAREVITNYAGELIQHDSSHHRWSPYVEDFWTGITSLDDYSRLILFGDLFERETSWAHISSVESVILGYGCPLKYYTDQHSIFRYVRSRDGQLHQELTKFTDDVDPQFKQVLTDLSIEPVYALSPQAKGKIERPYQWLQDRTVRRCAKDQVAKFTEVREIFRDEINRYNTRQVHSTTKEIPIMRFERAVKEGRSMFRPFAVPKPFQSTKDIFCFRTKRIVNHYQKISLHNLMFEVPAVRPGQEVLVRVYLEPEQAQAEVRIWHQKTLAVTQRIKITNLKGVHF